MADERLDVPLKTSSMLRGNEDRATSSVDRGGLRTSSSSSKWLDRSKVGSFFRIEKKSLPRPCSSRKEGFSSEEFEASEVDSDAHPSEKSVGSRGKRTFRRSRDSLTNINEHLDSETATSGSISQENVQDEPKEDSYILPLKASPTRSSGSPTHSSYMMRNRSWRLKGGDGKGDSKGSDGKAMRTTSTPSKSIPTPKRPPPLANTTEKEGKSSKKPETTFQGKGFAISAVGIIKSPKVERKISEALLQENGKGKVTTIEKRVQITVRSLRDIQIIKTLGIGASGRVSLAKHKRSGRFLAVKVVNIYDEEKRKQLLDELQTLMKFVSRFWVRFYGAFYDGSGAVYIALEFMDCGSLKDILDKCGPIPEKFMRIIALHCVHALKTLHETKWMHRDLKTANILLSKEQRRAKLSDFGLARQLRAGGAADEFVGTLAYLSPERLNTESYTYAADIWALGLTVAECLIGSHPFGASEVYFDYLDFALRDNDLVPSDGTFTDEARDFVCCCMKKDPNERPTAADLLDHPWFALVDQCKESEFEEWLTEIKDQIGGKRKEKGAKKE